MDGDMEQYTDAGCTANVILITPDKIFCANAGDSRAVICEGGEAVALSNDHKPENASEKERIEKADGFVAAGRTNGVLSLSRAIGDFDFKKNDNILQKDQIISAFPDVSLREIKKDTEFIICACDGIWDCLNNE